jgi:hypothetical protein
MFHTGHFAHGSILSPVLLAKTVHLPFQNMVPLATETSATSCPSPNSMSSCPSAVPGHFSIDARDDWVPLASHLNLCIILLNNLKKKKPKTNKKPVIIWIPASTFNQQMEPFHSFCCPGLVSRVSDGRHTSHRETAFSLTGFCTRPLPLKPASSL